MNELEILKQWIREKNLSNPVFYASELIDKINELNTPLPSGKSAEQILNEKFKDNLPSEFDGKVWDDRLIEAMHEFAQQKEQMPFDDNSKVCIQCGIIPAKGGGCINRTDCNYKNQQKEPKPLTDAVEFAEWLNDNGWIRDPFPRKEFNDEIIRYTNIAVVDDDEKLKIFTIKELYGIFKNKPS